MIAARVASGITAELGAMKSSSQLDAMVAFGVDPIRKLAVPRMIALFFMVPALTVVCDVIAIVGGWVIALFIAHVTSTMYWSAVNERLIFGNLFIGIAKPFVFSFVIAFVAQKVIQGATIADPVDLATSFLSEMDSLPEDQKTILKTVKKMNVVAYSKKGGTDLEYKAEKDKLEVIFDQEKYKQLGSFNVNGQNVSLMYLGEEDAIDEVIVFGRDDDKGLAVFRLLGDNMNPSDLMKLSNVIEKGNLDLSQLAGMEDIFK